MGEQLQLFVNPNSILNAEDMKTSALEYAVLHDMDYYDYMMYVWEVTPQYMHQYATVTAREYVKYKNKTYETH